MLKQGVWMLAAVPALVAGVVDWRWRRIPNWLTVPALAAGIAVKWNGKPISGPVALRTGVPPNPSDKIQFGDFEISVSAIEGTAQLTVRDRQSSRTLPLCVAGLRVLGFVAVDRTTEFIEPFT